MNVAVIADDLTGAAELASAAADLGFTAEVHAKFDANSDAQVIAIDTDTRTFPPGDAARIVGKITHDILHARPAWIYKKTDSVLRGNVRVEIVAILEAAGLQRAVYVPANPSKGRIIRQGQYSLSGKALHETAFASDPHHPRRSSNVLELLGESLRISIPDAENAADLKSHAEAAGQQILPAGGVEFFRAVLEQRGGIPATAPVEAVLAGPILFICGSPQARVDGRIEQFEAHRISVLRMPREFGFTSEPTTHAIMEWSKLIVETIGTEGRAALVVDASTGGGAPAAALSIRLAKSVTGVLQSGRVATACIEGGATAAAVLAELRSTRFTSLSTRSLPGVAAMRSGAYPGLTFLVKPGSYPWPDALFRIGL